LTVFHFYSQQSARQLLLAALLLSVSACSTVQPIPPVKPPVEVPPAAVSIPMPDRSVIAEVPEPIEINKPIVPVSPQVIETRQQNDAVVALLNSAESAQQQGDYKSAQSTLQRAQRIAPRDPNVYYRLAETHRNLEDYRLAEQVALKGVSIVQGQRVQLRRFWLLIADIRMQAGNITAAEQAEQIAERY